LAFSDHIYASLNAAGQPVPYSANVRTATGRLNGGVLETDGTISETEFQELVDLCGADDTDAFFDIENSFGTIYDWYNYGYANVNPGLRPSEAAVDAHLDNLNASFTEFRARMEADYPGWTGRIIVYGLPTDEFAYELSGESYVYPGRRAGLLAMYQRMNQRVGVVESYDIEPFGADCVCCEWTLGTPEDDAYTIEWHERLIVDMRTGFQSGGVLVLYEFIAHRSGTALGKCYTAEEIADHFERAEEHADGIIIWTTAYVTYQYSHRFTAGTGMQAAASFTLVDDGTLTVRIAGVPLALTVDLTGTGENYTNIAAALTTAAATAKAALTFGGDDLPYDPGVITFTFTSGEIRSVLVPDGTDSDIPPDDSSGRTDVTYSAGVGGTNLLTLLGTANQQTAVITPSVTVYADWYAAEGWWLEYLEQAEPPVSTSSALDHVAYSSVGTGGTEAWNLPNNATTDNGSIADTFVSGQLSVQRRGSAVLPFGATGSPLGLAVRYEANKEPGEDNYTLNVHIYEGTSSTPLATKSVTISAESPAFTSGTVGAADDLWSGTITAANMNNLRLGFSVENTIDSAGSTVGVDHIGAATLTYDPPPAVGGSSFPRGAMVARLMTLRRFRR
jgi:hypothetical protein